MVTHEDVHSQGAREDHGQADEADIDLPFIDQAWKILHRQLTGVDIDAWPGLPKEARLLLQDPGIGGRTDITDLDAADLAATGPAADALALANCARTFLASARNTAPAEVSATERWCASVASRTACARFPGSGS